MRNTTWRRNRTVYIHNSRLLVRTSRIVYDAHLCTGVSACHVSLSRLSPRLSHVGRSMPWTARDHTPARPLSAPPTRSDRTQPGGQDRISVNVILWTVPKLMWADLPMGAILVPPCVHGFVFRSSLALHTAMHGTPPRAATARARYEAAMSAAWDGLDGYCDSTAEAALDSGDAEVSHGAASGHRSDGWHLVYGEATNRGARSILAALGLTVGERLDHGSAPVFVDLGSGVGKLVALAAFEVDGLARAVGVECSEARHARALTARDRLLACLEPGERPTVQLEFVHGDMLRCPADVLGAATHVYVSSLLFSVATMNSLAEVLAGAPNVQAIATLQEFPSGSAVGRGFQCDQGSPSLAQMSWHAEDRDDEGLEVYVYRRVT